jgi:TonB family protein
VSSGARLPEIEKLDVPFANFAVIISASLPAESAPMIANDEADKPPEPGANAAPAAPPEPDETGDGGGEDLGWDRLLLSLAAAALVFFVATGVLTYLLIARDRAKLLAIVPPAAVLSDKGATAKFDARLTNAGGKPVGAKNVLWRISDDAVATVDANGVVTARDSGEAVITAIAGPLTATAKVTVQTPFAVEVKPPEMHMKAGDIELLDAGVVDTGGEPIVDAKIAWISSDPHIVVVNHGEVRAASAGAATVTAAADGLTGSAAVVVEASAPPAEASPEPEPTPTGKEAKKGKGHPPAAGVTATEIAVKGQLDDAKVEGTVTGYASELRGCYDSAADAGRGSAGRVRLYFNINVVGAVSSCAVTDNTTNSPAVGRCACERVQGWRFPPPTKGTAVVGATFIFSPPE